MWGVFEPQNLVVQKMTQLSRCIFSGVLFGIKSRKSKTGVQLRSVLRPRME